MHMTLWRCLHLNDLNCFCVHLGARLEDCEEKLSYSILIAELQMRNSVIQVQVTTYVCIKFLNNQAVTK